MTTWKGLNWFKFESSAFVEELKNPFTTIFTLIRRHQTKLLVMPRSDSKTPI